MSASQQAIGFWRGFSALFGAISTLLRLTRAWPYALVPVVVFLLLEAAIATAAWELLKPWVDAKLTGDSWWQDKGAELLSWVSVGLAAALGLVVSAVLAPPISSPALERIVSVVEDDLGAPPRAPLGFLAEFGCGLRSMLLSSAITLPIIAGLTLLELLVAPTVVVVTPLKLLIGALGVAWGLFDYPLTLRGVGARQRFGFVNRHAGVVLGFGAAFALVFWLPCCGILMLPVGVVAATRLLWEIERSGQGVLSSASKS
jgi:uncharacterized protein involved in cysteine biosynthesis